MIEQYNFNTMDFSSPFFESFRSSFPISLQHLRFRIVHLHAFCPAQVRRSPGPPRCPGPGLAGPGARLQSGRSGVHLAARKITMMCNIYCVCIYIHRQLLLDVIVYLLVRLISPSWIFNGSNLCVERRR